MLILKNEARMVHRSAFSQGSFNGRRACRGAVDVVGRLPPLVIGEADVMVPHRL